MNHKPECNTNRHCAVLHQDGICPNPQECDCGASAESEPQWEENIEQAKLRFWFLKYSSQDEFNADFDSFIKSTLEEVIEVAGEKFEQWQGDGYIDRVDEIKAQLRKEFL